MHGSFQHLRPVTDEELWLYQHGQVVDLFAGGGGASIAIEAALQRPISVALNHDPLAVTLHGMNHPRTRHVCQDIEHADPIAVTRGKPVFLLWASPSCTQHSRSRSALPAEKQLREMGWRVVEWIRVTRPLIVAMENVAEWLDWGPLDIDGYPIRERRGETWKQVVAEIQSLGYQIEWRVLNAADFGAPTSRERLFVVARRDGRPIRWPIASHGKGRPQPWRSASEHIDWSFQALSIFNRDRPLAPATMDRIFKGLKRFVIDNPNRFFAPAHAVPSTKSHGTKVAAFIAQNNSGMVGHEITKPISTLTSRCSNQGLVLAYLENQHHNLAAISAAHQCHAKTGLAGNRFGTVMVNGEPHVITDIGYRFFQVPELAALQGFPKDYRFDIIANGRPLAATHQKRMIGNSVNPQVGKALIDAITADFRNDEAFALAA